MMTYPDCNIYLGRNVVFCGDICSPGDAVVDGNIKGTIEAATVIVGKHAKVNGKISCQTGKFDGIVRGTVCVADRMTVGANGRLFATVEAVQSRIINRGFIIPALKYFKGERRC